MSVFARVRVTLDGQTERLGNSGWVPLPLYQEYTDSHLDGYIRPTMKAARGKLGRMKIARMNSSGQVVYELPVEPGNMYKLGPRMGFRIKWPSEEKDPIMQVARLRGIPTSVIRDPCEGEPFAWVGERAAGIHTDGAVFEGADGYEVVGFTYAITTFTKTLRSGSSGRFVSGVFRSADLEPHVFDAQLGRLNLNHRPEWLAEQRVPAARPRPHNPGPGTGRTLPKSRKENQHEKDQRFSA